MPTPQRLPIVNGDDGTWGDIIVQYLKKEHYDDGTDNPDNGGHETVTIRAGTATAGTAPLKLSSGTLLSAAEVGAVEFLTDKIYFTVTTGAVRKTIAIYDDSAGATGDVYYRDSSGNFVRLGIGTANQVLTVIGGAPSWQTPTGGVSDGDKGDITVTGSGATWTIDNTVVTYAKMQNVSATNRVLGRSTAGAGVVEEITVGGDLTQSGSSFTVTSASTTVAGKIEVATAAETTTGTDATRAVSPDGFAGSDYGKRVVQILVTDPNGSALTTGDGKAYFRVPSALNGYDLVAVAAHVTTVSTSGTPTIQIANVTDAVDMLSTRITIDANEKDSSTAATAAVIDTTKDDVVTADELRIDVDVAGTGTKGLIVEMQFQLP